jgi:tryptophanyl-tRNA synthetase
MRKRILTGIQPTGNGGIHIGNYLGAIKPLFTLQEENNAILFIADMHSMTSILDGKTRRNNTYEMLASLIALGFDFHKDILFKQSDVPEVGELSFYLSCLTQFNTLNKAHAFQDKNQADVNVGVFTYPMLMAADILLYSPDIIPVGKDQMQHLEITRTLANKINTIYGKGALVVPSPYKMDDVITVTGTDGRKMSKSYGNTLEIFEDETSLKKKIYRIPTSSVGANDPKDYETCNVFKLYCLFSNENEIEDMKEKYRQGIQFSKVKNELLGKILSNFYEERDLFKKIVNDKDYLDAVLITGKMKAMNIAQPKMNEIRYNFGFK